MPFLVLGEAGHEFVPALARVMVLARYRLRACSSIAAWTAAAMDAHASFNVKGLDCGYTG